MERDPLKIIGVTANCGNDTLGKEATDSLIEDFETGKADIMVINCQEANFQRIKQILRERCKQSRIPMTLVPHTSYMRTITKPDTLFHKSGMTTFILYRTDKIHAITRREPTKRVRGNNWNKGGFINTFEIQRHASDPHPIRLQTVSGHLNAKRRTKRLRDWRNIKRALAYDVKDFDELAKKIPDVCVAGYDANTRNLWAHNQATNPWEQADHYSPEISPLLFTPIAADLYSASDTYKVFSPEKTAREDTKRAGYANAGSLDFVAIQIHAPPPLIENTHPLASRKTARGLAHYLPAAKNISSPIDPVDTKRDHNVIGSVVYQLPAKFSPFNRVKYHMMHQLARCAPALVQDLSILDETPTNKTLLLNLYQYYLSPKGAVLERLTEYIKHSKSKQSMDDDHPWFAHHSLYQVNIALFNKLLLDFERHQIRAPQALEATLATLRRALTQAKNHYEAAGHTATDPAARQALLQEQTNTFYQACYTAIQTARPLLRKHHGHLRLINKMLDWLDRFLQQVFGRMLLQPNLAKHVEKLEQQLTPHTPSFFPSPDTKTRLTKPAKKTSAPPAASARRPGVFAHDSNHNQPLPVSRPVRKQY